jgi:hypothetical protein
VNALVAFKIVIPVETLWALVATEWSVGLCIGLGHVVAVKLLHGCVSTVVVHWHTVGHAVDECELTVGVADI